MKSLHLYLKKITIISFIILFFNCTNPKIELKNAQSQTKDRGYNLMTKVFVQHVIMLILNKTL